jgi:hypothetical protein
LFPLSSFVLFKVRNPEAVVNTYTSEEPDEEGGPLLNVPMRIASRQTRSAAGDRTKSELNSKYIYIGQCCRSMPFWCGSGSGSADPCL